MSDSNTHMVHAIRTDRTYKTRDGAMKVLTKAVEGMDGRVPYVIAVTEDDRFALVVIGIQHMGMIRYGGVTVEG